MPEATTDTTLTIRRTFKATQEQVFKALTDLGQMKQWMAPGSMQVSGLQADVRVGGKFRLKMKEPGDPGDQIAMGEYREITAPKKLVFSWAWEGADEPGDTLVTISLNKVKEGTELILTHEVFVSKEARDQHADGWNGCFAKLEKLVAA